MDSPALEHTILGSSVIVTATDQVSADLAGEAVILNLESGVYYSLDEVGAYIWSLIQAEAVRTGMVIHAERMD